ncbi:DUF1287 domain-containing protein [Clostridium sp. BNL1100]|uniref:DUF1287 domain-containing protein n=1 Tax=Clostridium sp. BNL1100 TaxID=755731 RepID=UPI00024A7151|nr:DUF1287 domain-containing protein [Clostridium sp. BNL1100]AEY65896.1 hypothetical protein Clo1100_1684 [Clostridium sp. BNL1100]
MKRFVFLASIVLAAGFIALLSYSHFAFQDAFFFLRGEVKIDRLICHGDMDGDGISDNEDIVQGARLEISNRTKYQSTYYEGGYPPKSEGVCTDVVWRALKNAGYDLKAHMDVDISKNTIDYKNGIIIPDPNIDFRRVKNQYVFFKKFATNLTTEVKPFDRKNLYEWQPGDIVILKNSDHVAVISDKRRRDGVPGIIHNSSTFPMEENLLLKWSKNGRIIGHFRFPQNDLE